MREAGKEYKEDEGTPDFSIGLKWATIGSKLRQTIKKLFSSSEFSKGEVESIILVCSIFCIKAEQSWIGCEERLNADSVLNGILFSLNSSAVLPFEKMDQPDFIRNWAKSIIPVLSSQTNNAFLIIIIDFNVKKSILQWNDPIW